MVVALGRRKFFALRINVVNYVDASDQNENWRQRVTAATRVREKSLQERKVTAKTELLIKNGHSAPVSRQKAQRQQHVQKEAFMYMVKCRSPTFWEFSAQSPKHNDCSLSRKMKEMLPQAVQNQFVASIWRDFGSNTLKGCIKEMLNKY